MPDGHTHTHTHRMIYTRLGSDKIESPDYEHWVARNM